MCNKEKFFEVLCGLIERPEWATDPRYATFAARLENRPVFNADLDAVLSTRTTADWMQLFEGRVPAAPVLDVQKALDNPFLAESKRIIDFQHPEHGPLPGIASSIRAGGVEHPDKAAPALGADTGAILATLGYSDDDVAALRTRGAVR